MLAPFVSSDRSAQEERNVRRSVARIPRGLRDRLRQGERLGWEGQVHHD
jgi:hypothetical protein